MTRGTDITQFRRTYATRNEGSFPDTLDVRLKKESDKKYGENPNQHCATYAVESIDGRDASTIARLTGLRPVRSDTGGKGGLSATNEMDITRAMRVLSYFEVPAAVIMKHTIVSAFAKKTQPSQTQGELFRLARDADRQSNFGGTAVFNTPLSRETAEALYELRGQSSFFVDVLAASDYDEGVLDFVQKQSANVRIAQFTNLGLAHLPRFKGDNAHGLMSLKEMDTGRMIVQDPYLTSIRGARDLVLDPMVVDKEGVAHVIQRGPTPRELDDLVTAWWLNLAGVKSNGIVVVRNGVTQAVGSGQVERFGAVAQCIVKGMQKAMDREGIRYDSLRGIAGYENLKDNPFKGASASSDAFFPFPDSVEIFGRVGVSAIVQPYGSIHDAEVIDAANKYNMAMPATLERCFKHNRS